MTGHPDDETERTLRYWKAAISTLAAPEQRAAAEEFLRRKLEGGGGADTLFALILLLEANGAFLLKLPEKLHAGFTEPIMEHLEGFESALLAQEERHRDVLGAFERVQREIAGAADLIEQNRKHLAVKIQMAAASINPSAIANSVGQTLEANVLHLLKLSLEKLNKSTEHATRASEVAERSAETWRKVHIRGVILTSLLLSALLGGCVLCWGWWKMENHYRTRLAAHVLKLHAIDDAYRQLLWLGISIQVAPREDASGTIVPDEYTMSIDDAGSATVQTSERGSRAVVSLKAKPLFKHPEASTGAAGKTESDRPKAAGKDR